MQSSILAVVVLYLVLLFSQTAESQLRDVDFDVSMGIAERGRYNLMLHSGERSTMMLDFFRNLYNKNLPSKMPYSPTPRIPKILHQIWVGPKPVPSLYKKYASMCRQLNKGWRYILWTDKDIAQLLEEAPPEAVELFKIYKQNLYPIPGKYAAQKDVLEYLILYKYGGVFLDMDVKCIQNMDEIVHKYRFFSALEPSLASIPIMTNAILGSEPHNHLFLRALKRSWKTYKQIYDDNNGIILKRLVRRLLKGRSIKMPRIQNTMMWPLAEELMQYGIDNAIVFPATYFNPIFPEPAKYRFMDEIKYMLGIHKNKGLLFKSLMPETVAVQDFFD